MLKLWVVLSGVCVWVIKFKLRGNKKGIVRDIPKESLSDILFSCFPKILKLSTLPSLRPWCVCVCVCQVSRLRIFRNNHRVHREKKTLNCITFPLPLLGLNSVFSKPAER